MSSLPTYSEPLLNSDGQPNDGWQMQRLVVTVLAVSLGSSLQVRVRCTPKLERNCVSTTLRADAPRRAPAAPPRPLPQFGFATGSLNNLEAVVPASLPGTLETWQWALINSFFSVRRRCIAPTPTSSPLSLPPPARRRRTSAPPAALH